MKHTTPALTGSLIRSAGRPVSPLSLAQWEALSKLANDAQNALSALSHALVMQACDVAMSDQALTDVLLAQAEKAENAKHTAPIGYLLAPQGEWTGGDSFAVREPHVMNGRRFTVVAK